MNKITVVFPMGGEGQRFGNKFKPFLKIFDKTFIELAIEPFLKHKDSIKKIVFIVRKDHSLQFNVINKINSFKLPVEFELIEIDKTNSPVETVNAWLGDNQCIDNVIFCDCDHSVDVSNIFSAINDNYDSIIMGHDITIEEVSSWSVASCNDGFVTGILEKQVPQLKDRDVIKGVIGCYYFKKFFNTKLYNFFSEVIKNLVLENKAVKIVDCNKAEFFGDPKRLNNLYLEKNASTVFCDIDGTIVKHENVPDYTKKLELLEGAVNTINKWRKDENCFIVLTTSRDEQFRNELEKLLREEGISYEYLIMNLPPGPRYLINDKKPYSDKKMALAHEVVRNIGIKNLSLGNSFANLKRYKNFIVKSIPGNSSDYQKTKFKAQYDSMKTLADSKFSYCVPSLGIFNDYSYTMENMIGYCGLHLVSSDERCVILEKVFNTLGELYNFNISSKNWLSNYIEEKIISKKQAFLSLDFEKEYIIVNDLLEKICLSKQQYLEPRNLSNFIMGDLTYENILTNGDSFKLIDFDNDNKQGAIEMDLGKLFQSFITKYEWWDEPFGPSYLEKEIELIVRFYSDILRESKERIYDKGNFYCALHLFRMVPYQAQRNMARARKALDLCIKILSNI